MIWESYPWREELKSTSSWLHNLQTKRAPSERTLFYLEKKVFLGCYIIRKLFEAVKLKSETKSLKFPVRVAARNHTSTLRHFNWHHINRHFHIEDMSKRHLKFRFVVNQIIHSYIFIPKADKNGRIKGFWFCSERNIYKELYLADLLKFAEMLKTIAKSEPSQMTIRFDPKTKKETIINK